MTSRFSPLRRAVTSVFSGLLIIIPIFMLLSVDAAAQSSTDSTTPLALTPGAPAGSYALSGLESINLYNGNLSFHIPLLTVGGRGSAQYTMTLPIEQHWRVVKIDQYGYPANVPTTSPWGFLTPGYGPGVLESRVNVDPQVGAFCGDSNPYYELHHALTRLTFTMPDGTEYEMRDQQTGGMPSGAVCGRLEYSRGTIFVTDDGSAATFIADYPVLESNAALGAYVTTVTGYLLLRDGTRYRIENGLVTWIRDRNGNRLSFRYDGYNSDGTPYGRLIQITDSLNRVINISYANMTSVMYDQISFTGAGGAPRTIRVWHSWISNVLRHTQPSDPASVMTGNQLFGDLPGHADMYQPYDVIRVSSIELPDGRSYQFNYNVYGEVARVTLPTGGATEYDYTPGSGVIAESVYRRLVERRTYPSGTTMGEKTTYNVNSSGNTTVTVEHRDSNQALLSAELHYFFGDPTSSFYTNEPFPYPNWNEGREYQTDAIAADGQTVISQVNYTWEQGCPVHPAWATTPYRNNPRLLEKAVALKDVSPNLISKQQFAYDCYNNQTDIYEYGFGAGVPGPLLRRTRTVYLTNNGYQGNINYATDTNIHIRNLPQEANIFDGNGNLVSLTYLDYDRYDPYPLQDCSGIVQHDGAFHIGYGLRGNLTLVTKFASINPGSNPASPIYMHSQYDIAGNVVKTIDPRGNPTVFDFTDRYGPPGDDARSNAGAPELAGGFSYAFPTKVTNALSHTTYNRYDYHLGKPDTSEDINGVVSSVAYNDPLDRPTQIVQARYVVGVGAPDMRRQTTFNYDDANHVITTRSDLNTFNDNALTSKSYYDDLGRIWRNAEYEGSTWSITDTQFDALGKVSQVSNRYRATDPGSASPPANLWTTTDYDALGRVVKVTTPDGAHVDTAYSGNQTTVTDQAGKRRGSETDALGRLVEVIEDLGGLSQVTSYLYDASGNLRKVTQGSQKRWFAYDSLSRLIRAKNPEQADNSNLSYTDPVTNDGNGWSMAYSYDANGNLVSKTDARNITTTYGYDGLNRNTTVSYSDSTPGVTRTYDTATLGKGRLQKTETAGSMGSRVTINDYDAMGRPKSLSQQFFYLGAWGTSYNTQQTYDLAGNVKTLTYPSLHTVTSNYDQAGRLSSFIGNLGGSPSTYADTIGYNPAGQMIKERFGTNTSLYHNLHYNNRMQLVSTRLGDSATDEWNWSRGAIGFYYGTTAVNTGDLFASDTDNNGNLRRQTNFVPLASGGYVIPQLDDYTYDPLNRIATIREQQRNENGQWSESASQAYSYDQWGNRTLNLSGGGGGGDQETVWVDDALPAGAVAAAGGGDSWNWVSSSPAPKSGSVSHISNIADWSNWSPPPYSGNVSHQSNISSGVHQHYYQYSPTPIPVSSNGNGKLYAYIFIDPENIPREVMLQWGTYTDGWEHRAYWGENIIGWGTDGTASRKYMGPLPQAGGWVRLEVPASSVGLAGLNVCAMAFTLYGGRASWDLAGTEGTYIQWEERCDFDGRDTYCYQVPVEYYGNYVLVDDSIPAGAVAEGTDGDGWYWRGANNVDLVHQHYFYNANATLQVSAGDKLFTWAYIDPVNPPSEMMLQWCSNESGWGHRAYWGANKIPWGTNGTADRRYMGPLPAAGGWVRLEVPASALGLEGKTVHGMAFTLYGGRAAWDKSGKVSASPPLPVAGPPINNRVYTVDTATNRLTSVNGAPMSYDPAGNQINDGSGQRTYDAENRMLTAMNGGVSSSYAYDADGKRVRRIIGGLETWQIYGIGGELLAEYAAGASPSAVRKEYGYRGGQLLVLWDGSETGDRQLQWLVQDHLGSTRMVVDRSGSLGGTRRHDFAPFGEELSAGVGIRSASNGYIGDSVRQKFGSKERDDETGLNFFGARYFSSVQGRFTSADPIFFQKKMITDPQRFNLYSYVRNNPLKYIDPRGEEIELIGDEKQRGVILQALKKALGDAGSYIEEKAVTKDGKTRYIVGIQSGKEADFRRANAVSQVIHDIIRHSRVAQVQLWDKGSKVATSKGISVTIGNNFAHDNEGPAFTDPGFPGVTKVHLLNPATVRGGDKAIATYAPAFMEDLNTHPAELADILIHEMGHVFGLMYGVAAPDRGGISSPINDFAVALENTSRRLRDPSAPLRLKHNNDPFEPFMSKEEAVLNWKK
jgi:RHS repeat-associated protein